MGLKAELEKYVKDVFNTTWTSRDGTVVPTDQSLTLANSAVKISGTVLYADLADSTKLVDNHTPAFAAEVYKTYLYCASKIIRAEGGEITAFDGDRVMAVFLGNAKNSSAVRAAMRLHYVVLYVINPAIKDQYPKTTYELKHVVGIDTSDLFVAKTGIRGNNDLVWVGRAANYAAKLSALDHSYPIWITRSVYDVLMKDVKTSDDGRSKWESCTWKTMNDMKIYRSTWWRGID